MRKAEQETDYFDIKELSRRTTIPISKLYTWVAADRIPARKVGKNWLFEGAEIQRWMDSFKRGPRYEHQDAPHPAEPDHALL